MGVSRRKRANQEGTFPEQVKSSLQELKVDVATVKEINSDLKAWGSTNTCPISNLTVWPEHADFTRDWATWRPLGF